jgi:hypothetical protein
MQNERAARCRLKYQEPTDEMGDRFLAFCRVRNCLFLRSHCRLFPAPVETSSRKVK